MSKAGYRRRLGGALKLGVCLLTFLLPRQSCVMAQPAAEGVTKEEATKTESAAKAESASKGVVLSGSWRGRVESWNWFEPHGDFNNKYTFGASLLRIGLSRQSPRFDWQLEFSQPTLLGLPRNAVAPGPQGQLGLGAAYAAANLGQDATLFVKQAFVRFKNLGDEHSSLRLGRFEFAEGLEAMPKDPTLGWLKRQRIAERLLSNFAFTHVQNSMDGLHYVRDAPGLNLTLLAARPTQGAVRLAGWDELNVNVLYGAVTVPLHRGSGDDTAHGQARVFVLNTKDKRNAIKTDNRPLAARQADNADVNVTTLGGHYARVWEVGRGQGTGRDKVDFLMWGGLQRGDWGRLEHRAWAGAVEAGYQFQNVRWKPWLRLGWSRASGDANPDDGRHRTFFPHFAARLYSRFPYYNMMNNDDAFVQLLLRPSPRLDIRLDTHRLRLSEKADLWYSGGGAFNDIAFGYAGRPSRGHKSLPNLVDISIDYRLSPLTRFTLYLGHAFGGKVAGATYASNRANFFYGEMTRSF